MEWGWEIFYGLATVVALSLSWKRGGEIAVLASLVAAMWAFQGCLFWAGQTVAGNLLGPMISGALLIFAVSLPKNRRSWQGRLVAACLVADLCLHVMFRAKGAYAYSCYVALNVLYIIQLIALGWSGGRIVLVGLGDWLARVRDNRNRVYGRASGVGVGVWQTIAANRLARHSEPLRPDVGRGRDRCVNEGEHSSVRVSTKKGGRSE